MTKIITINLLKYGKYRECGGLHDQDLTITTAYTYSMAGFPKPCAEKMKKEQTKKLKPKRKRSL